MDLQGGLGDPVVRARCQIKDKQFATTARLEPAIALVSMVAVTLLNLRDASRYEEVRRWKPILQKPQRLSSTNFQPRRAAPAAQFLLEFSGFPLILLRIS